MCGGEVLFDASHAGQLHVRELLPRGVDSGHPVRVGELLLVDNIPSGVFGGELLSRGVHRTASVRFGKLLPRGISGGEPL